MHDKVQSPTDAALAGVLACRSPPYSHLRTQQERPTRRLYGELPGQRGARAGPEEAAGHQLAELWLDGPSHHERRRDDRASTGLGVLAQGGGRGFSSSSWHELLVHVERLAQSLGSALRGCQRARHPAGHDQRGDVPTVEDLRENCRPPDVRALGALRRSLRHEHRR
uniref:Uncharacterized protein n=1 Tax=Hyaloperonospora arabidopsidis (strain Emoy2) TaxID=559515 RepID=M4BF96_HYAAE